MAAKLLPQTTKSGGALTKVNKDSFFGPSSLAIVPKRINVGSLATRKSEDDKPNFLKSILGTLEKIDGILKDMSSMTLQTVNENKKEDQNKKRKKREDELEKVKEKDKFKLPGIKIPGQGLFSTIIRFLLGALLARTFLKYKDSIPSLSGIAKTVGNIAEFTIDLFGKVLNGFVTFVDWGYKAYDSVSKFTKDIGGEGLQNSFDGFMGGLGKVLDAALIAAIAFGELGDGNGGERGGDVTGIRGSRTTPGRSRYGTSSQAARRYAQRFGKDAAIKRFGTDGVKSLGGKYARSGITNLARKGVVGALGKGGAKAALRVVKPLLRNIPIIGGLAEFAISWALGDPIGKAAFRGIGSLLVGAVGTAIGGPIGAAIGGFVGGEIGGKLYDVFFGEVKDKPKVEKRAEGGPIISREGRIKGAIKRKIDVEPSKVKRIIKITPDPVEPGKDAGGEEKIKTIYKDKDKSQKGETGSTYDYLVETTDELGKAKFFGPLFSIALKTVLGDKPAKADYDNAGISLDSWIGNELRESGLVPSDYSKVISRSIEDSVSAEVDRAIRDLRIQLMLEKDIKSEDEAKGIRTPEGIPLGEGETASGRALMEGLIQRGFTKEEAAAIVGNLWAESGFRTNAENPTSGAFGLMQWLGGRKSRLFSYAAEKGKEVTDKDLQLDYIKWELKGGNEYETSQFQKAMAYGSDIASKTKGFAYEVERAGAGELSSSMAKRIGAAESVYGGKAVAGEKPSAGSYTQLSNNPDAVKGSKLAGELGRFLDAKGLGRWGSGVHQHPEHPPWKPESGHSPGSLHYASKGARAIDIGGYGRSRGYDDQDQILAGIAEFNKMKGVKPVQLLKDGYPGHDNHVHVAYQGGGYVGKPNVRTPSVNSFASYDTPGSGIMIQPVIYTMEKVIPVAGGGGGLSSGGGLNINNNQVSLSRG